MDEASLTGLFASKKSTKKRKITLTDELEAEVTTENIEEPIPSIKSTANAHQKVLEETKLDFAYKNTEVTTATGPSATASNEYDTELDRDHRTRRQEALDRSKTLAKEGKLDSEYHGLKGYQQFLMQKDTARGSAASDKNRLAGPVRAAGNLRVTCRFDYKPDLCKDYNETGFCGFGDSCVFLHDRTEYKSGYQIEKEWDAEQARLKVEAEHANEMVKDIDVSKRKPTDCTICKKTFTRPVKTLCSHYFCEMCVLRKTKCPTCNAALLGSFKPAAKELSE